MRLKFDSTRHINKSLALYVFHIWISVSACLDLILLALLLSNSISMKNSNTFFTDSLTDYIFLAKWCCFLLWKKAWTRARFWGTFHHMTFTIVNQCLWFGSVLNISAHRTKKKTTRRKLHITEHILWHFVRSLCIRFQTSCKMRAFPSFCSGYFTQHTITMHNAREYA